MLPVKGLLRGGEGTMYFLYSQLFGVCFFALLYWMLAARVPGKHFKGLGMFPRFFDFLYFSMVTQTTVGYGDISPTSRLARGIAMVQLLLVYAGLGLSAASLLGFFKSGNVQTLHKAAVKKPATAPAGALN